MKTGIAVVTIAAASVAAFWAGARTPFTGAITLDKKAAFTLKEPLLIEGVEKNHYSLLPAGTVLYQDMAFAEGHTRYVAYFNIKGQFASEPSDPSVTAPLWLWRIDKEDLPKMQKEYPLTKEDLVRILKARKMTREDLAQIVREWTDE